jgi:palmitoyl-protein thioesterase
MIRTIAILSLASIATARLHEPLSARLEGLIKAHADKLHSLQTVVKPLATMPAPRPSQSGNYTPVALMHGLGDSGLNPGMQSLAASLQSAYPGIYASSLAVADGLASFFTPMPQQVAEFAAAVRNTSEFRDGFDAIALSQGGAVVRAYIEQYNDPPVRNFVSISGVLNGVFNCPLLEQLIPLICPAFELDPYAFAGILGFADYFVLSEDESLYLKSNTFLPPLNGQGGPIDPKYKTRFVSLNKVVAAMALNDTVVYPKESEQFGGYKWGTNSTVFTMREAPFYLNDSFGLRSLDQAGKVQLLSYMGNHLQFSDQWWNENIVPNVGV